MPAKNKSQRHVLTASANIDIGLDGGTAVLVALSSSDYVGKVDFQNTIDGSNYSNTAYRTQHAASPTRSVAQLTDPTTYTEYLLLPPLTQVRIKVTRTSGTLTVAWKEIEFHAEDPI